MPIYEYSCTSCGSRKEHLQKVSDPRLTVCPECGKETYEKQLTAAGFQLKGSGWYVTDFRNNSTGAKPDAKSGGTSASSSAGSASSASSEPGSGGKEPAAKDSGTAKADSGSTGSAGSGASTPAPGTTTSSS